MSNSRLEFSRSDKVRKAIMREVSDIIQKGIKDPRLADAVISVTDVDLSKDLRHAKLFVSIFGDAEQQTTMMDILTENTPKIRSELGKRVRLRYTPEIKFHLDDSLERGTRVIQLLDQINSDGTA